jgi:hypothetical protein
MYILDLSSVHQIGKRFKMLSSGGLPLKKHESHYCRLHRTHLQSSISKLSDSSIPVIWLDKHAISFP